jgi:hypothetical protein
MDTCEDTSMESHPNHRIECWIELERLFYGVRGIIGTPGHEAFYIEGIILAFWSIGRMEEKYGIIPFFYEVIINFRDFFFIVSEKSSSYRESDSFFCGHFFCLFWYEEKCDIGYLRAWNLERFEESGTLTITHDDKISWLEELPEHHFIFHLFDFE